MSAGKERYEITCRSLRAFNTASNKNGQMLVWTLSWDYLDIANGNDGILTVVDRATKMVHLVPVKQTITASETAQVYWTNIGRLHGLPRSIVSDRDPRFVSKFWQGLWSLLGTKLTNVQCLPPADKWTNGGYE